MKTSVHKSQPELQNMPTGVITHENFACVSVGDYWNKLSNMAYSITQFANLKEPFEQLFGSRILKPVQLKHLDNFPVPSSHRLNALLYKCPS